GKWYAIQHENVVPDVITTAKALGNGLPIGACIAKAQYADLMQPGTHGSTFGGNPLACAAALKTLQIMQRDKVSDEVQAKGQWLRTRLKKGLQNNVEVVEIRGRGLMIGIEMKSPAHAIKAKALDNGLIINVTRDKVIRLLPPLIISYDELETLADRLLAAFSLTPH
ncbi:MAG: aspartate aminotransferase family protein, partial [bacterium]